MRSIIISMLAWGVFYFIVVVDLVASLSRAFSFFSWYNVLIEFPHSFLFFFVRGRRPSRFNRLGAREAHQHLVGGIVRATGPDPFGNGMPLPTYHWGHCVGSQW